MPLYNLPSLLFSWAWSPQYLAQMEQQERPSGLILPPSASLPDLAFAHFSQMRDTGEFSWLWFFRDRQQAASLRVMQALRVTDALAELVQVTIPRSLPDCPNPTYLQMVDVAYLSTLPLRELGIDEVWLGYDYRRYISDRNARAATELVLSAEEFCHVGAR